LNFLKNANVTGVLSLRLNPEFFHCSRIKLVIKMELLLLFIKNGFDKFNTAGEIAFVEANKGIIK
jgi:hypothetical protein